MNFKQILENLIEVNTIIEDHLNEGYNCEDAEISEEYLKGYTYGLKFVLETLEDYGLNFDKDSFDEEYLDSLEDLNED